MKNDERYRSLKTFGREYAEEEKGSALEGLLIGAPVAIAGGIAGYHLGGKISPLVKKLPVVIAKKLREINRATDLSRKITEKTMESPIIKGILKANPDVSKQELYEAMKGLLGGAKVKGAVSGATLGGIAGYRLGGVPGEITGLRKAEKEQGYEPSTTGQALSRQAVGQAGGVIGNLLGVAAGGKLDKIMPHVPDNITVKGRRVSGILNSLRSIAVYGAPAFVGGGLGDAAGEYITSRHLQKHKEKQDEQNYS